MTFATQTTVSPRETCKCGEYCDERKGPPHFEHSHFVGATLHEYRWSTDYSQVASALKQSDPSERGAT